MGRVIEHRVVGIRCDVRTCTTAPVRVDASAREPWTEHTDVLARLVDEGWAFVCKGRLRAYCPEHAERIHDCVCGKNRRTRNCTQHSDHAAAAVWNATHIPDLLEPEDSEGALIA